MLNSKMASEVKINIQAHAEKVGSKAVEITSNSIEGKIRCIRGLTITAAGGDRAWEHMLYSYWGSQPSCAETSLRHRAVVPCCIKRGLPDPCLNNLDNYTGFLM